MEGVCDRACAFVRRAQRPLSYLVAYTRQPHYACPRARRNYATNAVKGLNGPGIALMGSLQINTGSGLGKVVHAVGL